MNMNPRNVTIGPMTIRRVLNISGLKLSTTEHQQESYYYHCAGNGHHYKVQPHQWQLFVLFPLYVGSLGPDIGSDVVVWF